VLKGGFVVASRSRRESLQVVVAVGWSVSDRPRYSSIDDAEGKAMNRLTSTPIGSVLGIPLVWVGRAKEDRVICMGLEMGDVRLSPLSPRIHRTDLDVLLEILRPFEGLATKLTLVWLQGHMDSNVGGDMVTLDRRGMAVAPGTGQVEVIGAFPAHMAFTEMVLTALSD
jgi:hypothetical protein